MSRILLIGESGDGFSPATGSGKRLAELLKVADAREVLDVLNLLNHEEGKAVPWDHAAGREAASSERVTDAVRSHDVILLAGTRVAAAFDLLPQKRGGVFYEEQRLIAFTHAGPFKVWRPLPHRWFVIPHPSGVSRHWNEPMNVRRARSFLRKIVAAYGRRDETCTGRDEAGEERRGRRSTSRQPTSRRGDGTTGRRTGR